MNINLCFSNIYYIGDRMRKTKVIFIKNAIILTVTGLLIRFIGMFFRVWLAGNIGAEGIGLYNQVFSFYMLASAFASTGINTAVTRMVSEELSHGGKCIGNVIYKCIGVTLVIALSTSFLMFFGADFISEKIIDDPRAADSLRTLTIALPFMGFSSCFKGYFIARKKTAPASTSQIFEQLVRIVLITYLVGSFGNENIGAACKWVILGDSVAEICSFIFIYISYIIDKNRYIVYRGKDKPQYSVLRRLRHIALPITVGRYLNSLLRTAENVLVPRQLEKSGMSGNVALSFFGVIKGMALPLIFFPASFLNALSTLLIPEMSEAAATGRDYKVRYTAEKCIHITLISSLPIAVIFFYTSAQLGDIVYKEAAAGEVIRYLAPIIPLMYMDSVCDGLLKGLDQQFSIFRNSMLDSLGRLGLIMLILPRYGIIGFIFIMYISNFFTCSMNLFRLIKISKAKVRWYLWFVFPAVSALTVGTILYIIISKFVFSKLLFTLAFAISTVLIYLLIVFKFKCITIDDLR